MKKVVFFCQADYAGSAYQAVQAVNSIGRIQARQIVCQKHPYGFDADIILHAIGGGTIEDCDRYDEACQVLEEADLIHCWNDEYEHYFGPVTSWGKAFKGQFPRYDKKYKSCTFTGTWYRQKYKSINARLKTTGIKLVVQDPTFIMDSMESTFIPHAVDVTQFTPLPVTLRNAKTIGCYHHSGTTANKDIILLKSILEKHPGWKVVMEQGGSNSNRLKQIAKCMFFMQNMDPNMIGYGRSTLEALVMGVPVINGVPKIYDTLMPDIPILKVSSDCLKKVITEALSKNYTELSEQSKQYVEKYHSYQVVGEQYTRFFEELLCG